MTSSGSRIRDLGFAGSGLRRLTYRVRVLGFGFRDAGAK